MTFLVLKVSSAVRHWWRLLLLRPLLPDLDRLKAGALFSLHPSLVSLFALKPALAEVGQEEVGGPGGGGGGGRGGRPADCQTGCRCSEGRRPH